MILMIFGMLVGSVLEGIEKSNACESLMGRFGNLFTIVIFMMWSGGGMGGDVLFAIRNIVLVLSGMCTY